jgi:anti-sigma B factor antagonist
VALEIVVEGGDGAPVVVATGAIDLASTGVLADAIDAASGAAVVVVDLSGVTFLDSSGLRVLAQQHRRLTDGDDRSRLALVVPGDPVARVLEAAGLATFFNVYATRDEARQGR